MGLPNQLYQEEWAKLQRDMERGKRKHTIVKLQCCGSAVEAEPGGDQYVQCPNVECRKRHLITWGYRPKIQTEMDIDL